jgi:hypothetical protein
MKKLIFILIAWIAVTVSAFATDVTIGNSVQTALPFNPSNIGNDRSITISVTNGSATVTSAALFPSAIVGKSGFQVTIAGVQYVVSGVASTSSLTLTTNYAGATGSPTLVLHKYVLLRIYATQSFQPFGASYVVQPGVPGSANFFKEIAVSILNPGTGNVAYYPEFTLPATTDATITNQARYVLGLYRPDNSFLAYYLCGSESALALPPTTPTSFTAICAFNSPGGIVPPNNEVYTKPQIDQRLPSCTTGQMIYYATTGNAQSCLTVGSGLSIAGGTITSSGGATINPTDTVVPYRLNSTTFADSSWSVGTNLAASSAITARASGAPTHFFRLITPADTGLTAGSESVGVQIGGNTSAATVTRQWATGGLATQRENLFVAPTYAFVGASLLTDSATVAITGAPIAGTNATITNQYSLWVMGGQTKLQGVTPLLVTQSIGTSGSPNLITVTGALHTTLAADTETTDLNFNLNRSIQFTAGGGGFPTERAVRFQAPTYAFTSADTITDAINVEIDTPRAGTNATLTNSFALKLALNANAHQGLWIDNSQASPTGNLFVTGIAGIKIFRIVPSNGDLNFVFSDAALGTTNTDGFIHYPSMAGVPTGVPTAYTGTIPTVIDTTNNRFYGYISGTWTNLSGSGGGGTTINPTDTVIPYRANATTFNDSSWSVGTSLAASSAITARTTGAPTYFFRLITPADTGLTASTESVGSQHGGNASAATVTRQWATGGLATQRENLFVAPTYAFVGASTLTDAATVAITGAPIAGTNATITNPFSLWVMGGQTKLQGITPLVVAQSIGSSGSPNLITVTGALHTTLAADTETTDLNFNLNRSIQFTAGGGGFPTERAVRFQAPTYAFTSADTITDAINVEIDTPRAGTNATLTNSFAMKMVLNANAHQGLWIDNSSASPSGNLFVTGIAGIKIFRIVPSNGDLNFVFSDTVLGTGNTDGFIHYPSMAGTPTGTATTYSGVVPTVIDSTNNLFYGYLGGAWTKLTTPPGGADGTLQYRVNATTFGGVAGSAVTTLGEVDLNNTARTSGGSTRYFRVRTPADTGLTADTESIGQQYGGNSSAATVTRQFTAGGGAFATQREVVFVAPTYAFTSGDTITNAATVSITGAPVAGTNATLTNTRALAIESGSLEIGTHSGFTPDAGTNFIYAATQGTAAFQSTSSTGYSGTNLYDHNGTLAASFQYGNSSASVLADTFFFGPRNGSAPMLFVSGAGATERGRMTNAGLFSFNAGGSPGAQVHVLAASAGTIGLRVDSASSPTQPPVRFTINTSAGAALTTGGNWQLVNTTQFAWADSSTDPTGATSQGLTFHSTGVVRVTNGSTGYGSLLRGRKVLPKTTAYTVLYSESDAVYTNEGAAASVNFTLPSATVDATYTFFVQDADGIQITAAAGDTIRVGTAAPTATGGNITSTTIGSSIVLVAINSTEWISIAVTGTWT